MFEWLLDPSAWMALATLTLLEIVLGIDNIIFISILVGKLPPAQRQRARVLGLAGAMGTMGRTETSIDNRLERMDESRTSACAGVSPGSTLPPGNSQ